MYDTRELKSLMKYFINNSLQLTLHCKWLKIKEFCKTDKKMFQLETHFNLNIKMWFFFYLILDIAFLN